MKYSTKLSDAVHTMVLIALNEENPLSSDRIAESIATNPSCVRQILSQLKKAGLIESVKGHPLPKLSRPASDITLLEVYKAVDGNKPLLHLDTHTNPDCGTGVNIQLALQDYYDEVQKDAEESMSKIRISDIIDRFIQKVGGNPGPISCDRPNRSKE